MTLSDNRVQVEEIKKEIDNRGQIAPHFISESAVTSSFMHGDILLINKDTTVTRLRLREYCCQKRHWSEWKSPCIRKKLMYFMEIYKNIQNWQNRGQIVYTLISRKIFHYLVLPTRDTFYYKWNHSWSEGSFHSAIQQLLPCFFYYPKLDFYSVSLPQGQYILSLMMFAFYLSRYICFLRVHYLEWNCHRTENTCSHTKLS